MSPSSSALPSFQSTLSMRRATDGTKTDPLKVKLFQSTLSMRRATLFRCELGFNRKFQSTLSMRRATERASYYKLEDAISIHALHEESDPAPSRP